MASKTSKKNPPAKLSNVIVTRKKSALENRKPRGRPRKTIKPVVNEIIKEKSPSKNKIETVLKDTPLQSKVKTLVKFVERVEYYPDKVKRDFSNKKIVLKPKHNYKIIASSNKRKLGVPHKGVNSPTKTCTNSVTQEPSMIEIVQLIEDNHNLSDEDFMEILTCPSPVWWEEPPDDDQYTEDPICTRNPDTAEQSNNITNKTEQNVTVNNTTKQTNKKQNNKNTQYKNNKRKVNEICAVNNEMGNKFNVKKQKLENVLCNIKNRTNLIKNDEIKNDSNSTDGDMSDLSYNEDEILKNLENLDIPVSQTNEISRKNDKIHVKNAETINNELILDNERNKNNLNLNKEQNEILTIDNSLVPKILPPLIRKPFLNNEYINKNSNSTSKFESDFRLLINNETSHKNNVNSENFNKDSLNNTQNYEFKEKQIKMYFENEDNEICNKKPINELAEYVTVYKIISNDNKKKKVRAKSQDNMTSKNNNEKKNMNSFFKKCKNNKRLKKSCTLPATSKDLNLEKEYSDEQIDCSENRLKTCEFCVMKLQNGGNNFSCADCEKSSLFSCDLCVSSTKPISSCKEVARMSWKHNLLVNET